MERKKKRVVVKEKRRRTFLDLDSILESGQRPGMRVQRERWKYINKKVNKKEKEKESEV